MLITHRDTFSCMYSYGEPCCYLTPYVYKIEVTADCEGSLILPFEMFAECISSILPDRCIILQDGESADGVVGNGESRMSTFDVCLDELGYHNMVYILPDKVCAESICKALAGELSTKLGRCPGVNLKSVKLIENSKSYVTWNAPDNK